MGIKKFFSASCLFFIFSFFGPLAAAPALDSVFSQNSAEAVLVSLSEDSFVYSDYLNAMSSSFFFDGFNLSRKGVFQLTLKTGMRVFALEYLLDPLVSIRIFIKNNNSPRFAGKGLAKVVERIILTRDNFKGPAEFMEISGSSFGSVVTSEFSCYYLKVPANLYKQGLEELFEWIFEFKADNKQLEKIKNEMIAKSVSAWDNPSLRALNALDSLLNKGDYDSSGVNGNPGELKNVLLSQAADFHKTSYIPSECVVLLGGNISSREAAVQAADVFNQKFLQKNSLEKDDFKKGNTRFRRQVDSQFSAFDYKIKTLGSDIGKKGGFRSALTRINVNSLETSVMAGWPGVEYSDSRSLVFDFLAFITETLEHAGAYSITPVLKKGFFAFEYKKPFEAVDYIHINEVFDFLKNLPGQLKKIVNSNDFLKLKEDFIRKNKLSDLSAFTGIDKALHALGIWALSRKNAMISSFLTDPCWERKLENENARSIISVIDEFFYNENPAFIIAGSEEKLNQAFLSSEFDRLFDPSSIDPDSQILKAIFPDFSWCREKKVSAGLLANNIYSKFIIDPLSELVNLFLLFKGGRNAEPAGYAGVSDLAAACMIKNPESFLNIDFEEIKKNYGLNINAFSGPDYTCLKISCPESSLKMAFKLLEGVLKNRSYSKKGFSLIKKAMDFYFNDFKKSVFYEALKKLDSLLFDGSSGYLVLNDSDLENIGFQHISDYSRKYFKPENAGLLIKCTRDGYVKTEPFLSDLGKIQGGLENRNDLDVKNDAFIDISSHYGKVYYHEAPLSEVEQFFFLFESSGDLFTSVSEDVPGYAAFRLASEILNHELLINIKKEGLLIENEMQSSYFPESVMWVSRVKNIFISGVSLKKGYLKRAEKILAALLEIGSLKGFGHESLKYARARVLAKEKQAEKNLYYQAFPAYVSMRWNIENYYAYLIKELEKVKMDDIRKCMDIIAKKSFQLNVLLKKSSE